MVEMMQKNKKEGWLKNIEATVLCWSNKKGNFCKKQAEAGSLYCSSHKKKASSSMKKWEESEKVIEKVRKIFFLFCFGIKSEAYPELPPEMRAMIWECLVNMFRTSRGVLTDTNKFSSVKNVEKVFGVKNGKCTTFSVDVVEDIVQTKHLLFQKSFRSGFPQGEVKRNYVTPFQNIEEKYSLCRGLLHGEYDYDRRRKTGNLHLSGHFTQGTPDGKWTMKKARETLVIENPNGRGECFRYDEKGNLKERGFHSQRAKVGCWIFYDELGEKRAGSYDEEGKKHGVWQSRNHTSKYVHGKVVKVEKKKVDKRVGIKN